MSKVSGDEIEKVRALCQEYGIEKYEITDDHFGNSVTYGPLKKLIVYDHFINVPEPFNKLGFGVINRQTD